jgi:hypothetical protein
VLDLHNPYKLITNSDGTYSFVTDGAIEYVITMDDASYYVEDLPPIFSIYEFGFYPKDMTISKSNNKEKSKLDNRIKDRIKSFLVEYLKDSNNSLLVIYESLDAKHEARFKLFDKWFRSLKSEVLEKHDKRIEIEGSEYPILGSLIIHSKNEYKLSIIQMLEDTILMKNDNS